MIRPTRSQISLALLAVTLVSLVLASQGQSAYLVRRPLASTSEPINQEYLYGEGSAVHRGLDWSQAGFGDDVYAVAPGIVRDMRDGFKDGCHPGASEPDDICPAWGNFVLIEHDVKHYDRVSGQMGYVYSLYLHLRQLSVTVGLNEHVTLGQKIGEVDNTGNSTGTHLHYQVIVHPEPNRKIIPYTVGSEERSRNPELWLTPYPSNRATAVGLVTDSNGNPLGDKIVCGIKKTSGINYGYSLTYPDPVLNPDDILLENFATTDVLPGTYHVRAYEQLPCGGSQLVEDFGLQTFEAGKTTYIGLHPVWLPYVRGHLFSQVQSTIYIRNNSIVDTARVNITLFNLDGSVRLQDTRYISPNATTSLSAPSDFEGSGLVVSSQDVVVVVENVDQTGNPYKVHTYTGIANPEETTYLPAVYNHQHIWSTIFVQNTSRDWTSFQIRYYKRDGTFAKQDNYTIGPNEYRVIYAPSEIAPDGSAIISSNDEMAVVSRTKWSSGRVADYSGVTSSGISLLAPSVYRLKSGSTWTLFSATVLQNTSQFSTGNTVKYISRDTGNTDLIINDTLPGYSAQGYNTNNGGSVPASTFYPLGDNWDGSVQASASRNMSGIGTTVWAAIDSAGHYSMVTGADGGNRAFLPLQRRHVSGGNWTRWSAINVTNVGTSATNVTITYYDTSGNALLTLPTRTLYPGQSLGANTRNGGDFDDWRFGSLGNNYTGSVVVQANGGDAKIVGIANLLYGNRAGVYDAHVP